MNRWELFRAKWLRLRPWRRHSLVLLVAGLIYFLIGIAYAFLPGPPGRSSSLRVPLNLMPMGCWAVIFMLVGMLSFLSSRWPPASTTWGYTAMSSLSALWAGFYVWGIILGAPASGTTGALIWSVIGFMWWAISGLYNAEDIVVQPYPNDEH